jgi:hypothetical protein
MIWWIIGFFAISFVFLFVFWSAAALGARRDVEMHELFIKMMKEENNTWKYDLTETTTSGCPVDKK